MILWFLLYKSQFFHHQKYLELLNHTDLNFFSADLKQGETHVIESNDPGLCVIFFKVSGISIQIFSNTNEFLNETNPYQLAGFDFGNYSGKIIFTAKQATKLEYSALVFPTECLLHRLISTFFNDNVAFFSNSLDSEYKIESNQTFCYWNALPLKKKYHILTDTEKSFDRLIRFSSSGQR